jgi:hypothetical protein
VATKLASTSAEKTMRVRNWRMKLASGLARLTYPEADLLKVGLGSTPGRRSRCPARSNATPVRSQPLSPPERTRELPRSGPTQNAQKINELRALYRSGAVHSFGECGRRENENRPSCARGSPEGRPRNPCGSWGFSGRRGRAENGCARRVGGGRGIRTLDTVSRIHAFQACAFNHSATPPSRWR